jgi:hypothetical protein
MLTALGIAKAIFASTIGRYALIGIGSLIGLWAFGAYKERTGYNACKAEWSAAEQAAIKRAEDARRDGERDAASDAPRVQDDRHNRDND